MLGVWVVVLESLAVFGADFCVRGNSGVDPGEVFGVFGCRLAVFGGARVGSCGCVSIAVCRRLSLMLHHFRSHRCSGLSELLQFLLSFAAGL